eukprot:jgi/Tetstr1/460594/TSEL_000519.t1
MPELLQRAEYGYEAVRPSAGVDVGVVAGAGVAAKDAFGSGELGQRTLDLLSSSLTAQTLESYAGRLSQFAEFCHDSENISPLEATTATVVRYVAWIGDSALIHEVRLIGEKFGPRAVIVHTDLRNAYNEA